MAAHGRQTVRIRVSRAKPGGSYRPCATCGGSGVVKGAGSAPKRTRLKK